jgi:putative DNA primase/helicase
MNLRHKTMNSKLFKQFMADAYLPTPQKDSNRVLINLKNGTFEIDGDKVKRRDFKASDFLTYQLPFEYDEKAACPQWQVFLDQVLPDPDRSRQKILAEYIAYT